MGDRGNVFVIDPYSKKSNAGVWLYSHWGGTDLPCVLRDALARKQRWDDNAYLTRIIFCRMVRGHETDESGFGISTTMCDNEYNVLVVDTEEQRVGVMSGSYDVKKTQTWASFAEYAQYSDDEARRFRNDAKRPARFDHADMPEDPCAV